MDGGDAPEQILYACVKPNQLPSIWPLVEGFLKKACDQSHGRWGIEDVRKSVFGREFLLYIAFKPGPEVIGVWTVVKQENPNCRTLMIHFLGGEDFHIWGPRGDRIMQELARLWGCKGIEFVGRDGWTRKLSALGYKSLWRTYFKEV